ncbi:GYF domain protein [Ostertagia ostertagi]
MRSTFNGGGSAAAPVRSPKTQDYPVAAPIFVKNRYGREDMLALMGDAAGHPPPEGLQNCPFYVEEALPPIVCYPLSDLEQRLQQNINSSKAMSSLSHAERASVATGAAYSGGGNESAGGHKGAAGGWTPVKQWGRNHPNAGAPVKGGGPSRPYVPPCRNANRGRGGSQAPARGGGVSGTAFNSRAQGLYDPRDPKGNLVMKQPVQRVHLMNMDDSGRRYERQKSTNNENQSTEKSAPPLQTPRDSNPPSGDVNASNTETDGSRSYMAMRPQAEQLGYHSAVPSQHPGVGAGPVPSAPPPMIHPPTPQFFYLDPTKQERGPFEKLQMDSWYKRGYFTEGLEVRRHTETKYRTLGELMQLNGRMTPFDYKDDVASHPPVTMFSNPSQPYPPLFASGGMWSDLGAPANMMYSQAGYDPIAAERKRIEEEQRRILEEQAKMREYQEHLVRELQKQREEHEKQLMEQKLALLKHQEEIERRERELKESAEETKARLEMERLALAEKARQIEEERLAKIEKAAEEARKNAAAQAEKEKRQESAKSFEIEEVWQAAPKPSQAGADGGSATKKSSTTKVAPWVAASAVLPAKEKTLKEIQEEEERQLRAEQAQQARLRKEQETINLQASATWSNASQRLQWSQPAQQSPAAKTAAVVKPAWGGAGVEPQKAASSPFWDGPPLQTANKAPSNPSKKSSAEKVSNTKSSASKSGTNALANEKAAKRALGMGEDNSVFLEWVVQRLKELNSTVEAEVLAMFIEGVENPDEVEDYVMGYLGDSKAVKEFVREFLLKRSDFRNRKQHGVKNDLSSARGAPVSGNGAGFSAGARLVVDGSCLGFRATSDPNRVNQGEIETVTIASGQKR